MDALGRIEDKLDKLVEGKASTDLKLERITVLFEQHTKGDTEEFKGIRAELAPLHRASVVWSGAGKAFGIMIAAAASAAAVVETVVHVFMGRP